MKTYAWVLVIVLAMGMGRGMAAETLTWDGLKSLAAGTPIWVMTNKTEACVFEKTVDETLYCRPIQSDMEDGDPKTRSFRRDDVRWLQLVPRRQYWKLDDSSWLDFVMEFGGGAAVDKRNQPNGFGSFKVGRAITLNMNLDCVSGHCGFGVENAGMIPVARYPGFVPGKRQNFARLYLEPGVGYRFGQGPYGAYTSAGALIMLWKGASKTTPYLEYTHRFPFGSPWQGDNRIAFGVMVAVPQGSGW
jgi:hypothetical protein